MDIGKWRRIRAGLLVNLLVSAYSSELKKEVAISSELLETIYQTTWFHIPDDGNLLIINLVSGFSSCGTFSH